MLLTLIPPPAARAQTPQPWSFAGADIMNSHASLSAGNGTLSPRQISPATASLLHVKWAITTSGAISATPTVEAGGLYVPDWGGSIYKIDPDTGAVIWSHKVTDYTGLYGSFSRSSPAIGATNIVIGDGWPHTTYDTSRTGARVIGINKTTGALAWQTVVDTTSVWSEILGSPVIYGNLVYVGTASWEEVINPNDATFVPSFRGSISALDVNSGKIVWQKFLAPPGYTGVAVPGSNPVVSVKYHSLIIATGNNYTLPHAIWACVAANFPSLDTMVPCIDPMDYVDSVMSFDLTTGALLWSRQFGGPDTWNESCSSTDPAVLAANCQYPYPAPDFDFASQPNLAAYPAMTGVSDDRGGTNQGLVLGIGQKSGIYRLLNPANGGKYWEQRIGFGGIEWGSAINTITGDTAFIAINNFQHITNSVAGWNLVPFLSNGGSWASVNLQTGAFRWQIAAYGQDLLTPAFPGSAPGAVAFTNGVVFAGSSSGVFAAMDAATGHFYWTFQAGTDVHGGAAIFNDTVYWGAGYKTLPAGLPSLYAFSVQ